MLGSKVNCFSIVKVMEGKKVPFWYFGCKFEGLQLSKKKPLVNYVSHGFVLDFTTATMYSVYTVNRIVKLRFFGRVEKLRIHK